MYPLRLACHRLVPVSQPPHQLCREAQRLAAVQQNRQDATSVHLALKPLRDVAGAEDLSAQRAKGLRRLLEPSLNVVMVGQVLVEQRAEVHERLREADGAATIEQQVRGVASAVGARPRRAEQVTHQYYRLVLTSHSHFFQ